MGEEFNTQLQAFAMTSRLSRSFLGVTPPIATTESNEREKEVTETLMDELRRQNTFEGADEARKRCGFAIVFEIPSFPANGLKNRIQKLYMVRWTLRRTCFHA